ncbi:penicillin-binding protein 2 [Patescibacteria group bacterium]|nr:penicillin-binding protein 2 [Patescibacteria group bacterium]
MRKARYSHVTTTGRTGYSHSARIVSLTIFAAILFVFIIGRLFQLQILKHNEYSSIAEEQHFGAIDLPARRGEILVQDTHSGEFSKLATNTTLDLLYVDPLVAEDKNLIAKSLAPLLFTETEYEQCVEMPEECIYEVIQDEPLETFLTTEPVWDLGLEKEIEVETNNGKENFKSYYELTKEVEDNIFRKISKLEIDFVILRRDADEDLMANVINARLPGIFVDTERFMIYGDPTLIPENQLNSVAKALANHLDESVSTLESRLTRRKVRYVFLKNKLDPDVSRQIKEIDLKGVVLLQEHWRYYPESDLGSHLIGFLSRDNVGQYGIEGYFNVELEGKKGKIYAESDPFGRQITVGESKIVNAIDGDTIVLTIDRIVQKEVENILAESVEKFRADSGQVIIMNPFTGAIIAMANYPTFDSNHFSDAYILREVEKDEEIYDTVEIFTRDEKGAYMPASTEDVENEEVTKYVYENKFGSGVFKNKTVSEFYEPGSVFKPIVMSIAIDSKEVEPQTKFDDDGPLQIDEFEIKNSDGQYHGQTTMTEVLELSLNTGMSHVAQLLGKQLMYKYIKDYGFGEYTNIRLEGETKGEVDYYKRWSKAQLLTTSFGQGIIVTPLQMVTAWAAIANGGKLIQPYIVDSIIKDNEVIKTEPQVIHRVITEETSSIMTSMLISVVRRGHGRPADIPGYLIAGKTGTSQIAGKYGEYETGEGATITSFAGYFPALQPQFVMLVKFDRPRIGENTWGSTTAAPTFRRITEFLIDYYNIQANS